MTTVPKSSPNYNIAVVRRALDVLDALGEADGPLGTTELARRVGTTKSAVYRILATLEERNYVTKDPVTSRYRLGTHLAFLGERSLVSFEIRQTARAALEDLYNQFHETVNLGVLDDHSIVYIDIVEREHGLRMAAQIGDRDPAHSTSLGKAILAFLPEAESERYLQGELVAQTRKTLVDPELLRAEFAQIRKLGYAEDDGENEEGARCFGAPVFDHTGTPIAAISVSTPASRLDDNQAMRMAQSVKLAARDVSHLIGGRFPQDETARE